MFFYFWWRKLSPKLHEAACVSESPRVRFHHFLSVLAQGVLGTSNMWGCEVISRPFTRDYTHPYESICVNNAKKQPLAGPCPSEEVWTMNLVFSWFSTVGLYSWHRCAQCIPFCSYFIWMHWYWYTTILGSVQPSATVLCRNVSAPWKNSSPDVICFLDCTATCLRSWGRGIHINIHHQIECFLHQPVSTFAVYHCWIANYRFCFKDPFSNKSQ